MSTNELFADGIAEISITGPLIRMDLFSHSATQKDAEGNPQMELRQRVIMPVDGFVRSFGMLESVMRKLIQEGIVKVAPASQAPETNAGVTALVSPH